MPIKSFRPITPTLRFQTKLVNDDLTTDTPHKPLLAVKQRTGGRNSTGRLSIRHQGGSHKKKLRLIDFKRDMYGIPAVVACRGHDAGCQVRLVVGMRPDRQDGPQRGRMVREHPGSVHDVPPTPLSGAAMRWEPMAAP